MRALVLSFLFAIQGIPIQPTQGGMVAGILLSADGKPAAGVRVMAVPQTDSIAETINGGTLSSIAETDEQGRYTLENVPPGRYYIAAGRLDLPTYYPGTQGMGAATNIQVASGVTLPGINFTLNATSSGRAFPGGGISGQIVVPLDVRVVNGKLPISSGGKFTTLVLSSGATTVASVLKNASNNLPLATADYRVAVEGLPEGYTVTELKFGPASILGGRLIADGVRGFVAVGPGGVWSFPQVQVLSVVIDGSGSSAPAGARVRGTIRGSLQRLIYLSGTPGSVFSDGTFEFRNVSPGRHTIATLDNPPSTTALAAVVIVGNEDINGIEVESISALPLNPRALTTPGPAGARPPGTVPLASIRGRVIDAETSMAVTTGTVFVVGDTWAPSAIGPDGRFEFQRLLPGSYEIEVQGVGYPTFRRAIVVDEQDLDIELKAG